MYNLGGTAPPASTDDAEEASFHPPSTVPTTPEGSITFSPVVRAESNLTEDGDSISDDAFGELLSDRGGHAASTASTRSTPVTNICCVGAGYVGGPTAAVIAFQNPHIRVTVVDRDERRIRRWNSKHPTIYEPGLRDIVRVARDGANACSFQNEPAKLGGSDVPSSSSSSASRRSITAAARKPNLFFSTEVSGCIAEADIVLVAVNTPTKTRGHGAGSATDMAAFEAVTAEVARHARPGAIIVEKSTVPCMTAELVRETLAAHRPGVHFEIVSNPEFLAAGTAVNDLLHPDRVLIGSDTTSSGRRAAEALAGVYAAWVPRARILTTNVWSSELAKLVANSMLAQRISSINSISAICERTGADVDEVAASVGRDPRIGDRFLKAGIGFGGSCFKKDILSLVYLAESLDLDEVGEYWRQVVKMNEYQRDRFTRRVVKCLNNTLTGKKVTMLGYAFKKNTSDTRESPALEIIRTLLDEEPREMAVFDPCCNPLVIRDEIRRLCGGKSPLKEDGGPLTVCGNVYDACRGSNAVLITTEFDEFRNTKAPPLSQRTPRPSTASPRADVDPRPFRSVEVRQADVLALQWFLAARQDGPAGPGGPLDDPLGRYVAEPGCADDCPDCRAELDSKVSGFATGLGTEEYKPKERVDWARVAGDMQVPRWVFDGRGVVDAKSMAKLGVRVESIGGRGRS
ncbi:nucleotide sugar dehydrogenase [Colletotrichum graminicola M1.001]|uniref:UDP-glucose 6-dehydrogenase n=1 Tax=Colletotrichum graminicola (strain M1.001 / M2 / FGSC 10212) TaxID=645133 RepID=E3QSG1_COLGM|nr:nucleotide sugar dehydrogenase [Colletotrichum graminicola M1.001]EFQ33788.1 nucleotide sugar dehydrogenase [Colletotrichum graminicola M1.001]